MIRWPSLRAWFGATRDSELEAAIRLHEDGRFDEAEARYRALLVRRPRDAEAMHLLGLLAHQRGSHALALKEIGAAIALAPDKAHYRFNLGNALLALGRLEEASAAFRAALALEPAHLAARSNLAQALMQDARHEEAAVELRRLLAQQPRAKTREALVRALVACADADPAAAANYDEAAELLATAPEQASDPLAAQLTAAHCRKQRGRFTEAAEHYRAALALQPDAAGTHNELANCYNQLGGIDEAIFHYRETYRLDPEFSAALTALLGCLNYDPACTPEASAAEHRRWAREVAARHYPPAPRFDHAPDAERRLHIGYVSPDFRRHPVSAIFAPVLAAHDRERFEISCYYSHAGEDAVTLRLKSLAGRWRAVAEMDDTALAEQIRADGIDILVDLAGHTTHNRLLAFARRPAPVQVSWLGYFNTTGLATMDYFLSDPWSSPTGQERYYVERLVRLPQTRFCYEPPQYMPEVAPLPARSRGCITFGSLNNLSKLNASVLTLWSQVLAAVPSSRLLVQAAALDDAPNRARFAELCEKCGIAGEHLELRGFVPFEQVPRSYAEIDIALDPFPFCGGMTSLEALWLGVPVITLPGENLASRQSASMLMNLELPELIAEDRAAYVTKAATLAQDTLRLEALRAGLRRRFAQSPLMDYSGFARALEAAYRNMWRDWLAANKDR